MPSLRGWFSFDGLDLDGKRLVPPLGAALRGARTTTGRRSSGFARSCGWLSMYVGLPWIHGTAARRSRRPRDRLAAIPGVDDADARATAWPTLVTFRIAGWTAGDAVDGARVARSSPSPGRSRRSTPIRISVGFFNTDDGDRAVRRRRRAPRRPHAGDDPAAPRLTIIGQDVLTAPRPGRGAAAAPVAGPRSAGASSATRRDRSSGRSLSSLIVAIVLAARLSRLRRRASAAARTLPGGDLRVLFVAVVRPRRARHRQRRDLAGRAAAARLRRPDARDRRGARRWASSRRSRSATSSSWSSSGLRCC